MPEYKSNAKSVIDNLKKQLHDLEKIGIGNMVRAIASDVAASNVSRIHNDGKAVDGSSIGSYSPEYSNHRKKKGRQTNYVDLSFTGKLSKEFLPDSVGTNEIGVGFLTPYGAELSEHLEEKYRKKIWGVTQEDERVAQEIAKKEVRKYA
jgi:hypothetical protein